MKSQQSFKYVFLHWEFLYFFYLKSKLGIGFDPLDEIFPSLLGGSTEKSTWHYIIIEYRLPKALTAICVGSSLECCQFIDANPL